MSKPSKVNVTRETTVQPKVEISDTCLERVAAAGGEGNDLLIGGSGLDFMQGGTEVEGPVVYPRVPLGWRK